MAAIESSLTFFAGWIFGGLAFYFTVAKLLVKHEREDCARIAYEIASGKSGPDSITSIGDYSGRITTAQEIARAIRSRGKA